MKNPKRAENMKLVFRVHAIQRMFKRGINEGEVRHVIETGKTIEAYPDDLPYPSRLIAGKHGKRFLHVVVADNISQDEVFVITTYEPDPDQWSSDFERRNP